MGCGSVWQSDADAALDESMRCNPNTHSYSYTYTDEYSDDKAASYYQNAPTAANGESAEEPASPPANLSD